MGHLGRSYVTGLASRPANGAVARKTTESAGASHDIPNRKRREDELRRAKEAAEAASRAKNELLAVVSHEIRTPMSAIAILTELMLQAPLDGKQRECLVTVKTAADSLLGMVDDLLDVAKIDAGKAELADVPFSLRAVVEDVIRLLSALAHRKGIKLLQRFDSNLSDRLVGDVGRLRQILFNLVGNAIKFTDVGEVAVEISGDEERSLSFQEFRSPPITLRFVVRDSGIGIANDQQERIFGAFEQENAVVAGRREGTGLGLSIASRLAALMGGSIAVESTPGLGSTFTFTAQFRRGDETSSLGDDAPFAVESSASSIDVDLPSAPLRILAADDDEFNVHLLEQLLLRRGHRLQVAKNGSAALAMAKEEPFDLLLLDVHMPGLDGFQVAHAIREFERTTGGRLPIIALTARTRAEDRERCLAAGMNDFLTKPIRANALWSAIQRAIASKSEQAQPGKRRSEVGEHALTPRDVIRRSPASELKIFPVASPWLNEAPSLREQGTARRHRSS